MSNYNPQSETEAKEIDYASLDKQIDAFIECSRQLNGREIEERPSWNTRATADAIRHFAYGISDDNPLWVDPLYAAQSRYGSLVAPPAFVASVLYPALHGAAMEVPLSNLISELECEWYRPILENDRLRAIARQTDVLVSKSRQGKRLIHIIAEINYYNQRNEIVAKATTTLVRTPQLGTDLLTDRMVYSYSDSELNKIQQALEGEERTGRQPLEPSQVYVGQQLPTLVRGPLTIGDMICWQAAIGPSYRGGALSYLDGLNAPHTMVRNPVTGWPVKYSQQHEDAIMSRQRGMPAPFDNTVMRWGWVSAMFTNWMGDAADIKRLRIHAVEPILYGDTNWYESTVSKVLTCTDHLAVTVRFSGRNQLGIITTTGEAEIALPLSPLKAEQTRGEQNTVTDSDPLFSQDLFEQQVQRTPDAIALRFEDKTLTYAQLNNHANALAQRLLESGAKPNKLIAVCLPRSHFMVISQLAILKAGGVYVPLDPEIPEARLEQMVSSCKVDILIADSKIRDNLPRSLIKLNFIDAEELATYDKQTNNPIRTVNSNDLAYVMYTSGSVNTPKAAAIMHSSLGLYLAGLIKNVPVQPHDVYLHSASASFSAAIRQTLLPLCSGAALVIAGEEPRRAPRLLLRLLQESSVTVWDSVPSLWRACILILREMTARRRSELLNNQLRLILMTGERLDWETPNTWAHEFEHRAQIINLYSQTETSGTVCLYKIPVTAPDQQGAVPIGQPIDDVSAHILDENLRAVEQGTTGELCVAGKRIAVGYYNQPGATFEKFITNPFSKNSSDLRLYRTGDLVRLAGDGNIEIQGRKDHRVKLRGLGIDLTEVETVLRTHPQVSDAAVVVHDEVPDDQRLIAYVIQTKKEQLTVDQLISFLQQKLTDYMIPNIFVWLEELPLTTSGKLDRIALPSPELNRPILANEFVAPRKQIERELAMLWKGVLNLDKVGINDDFLFLGGHSLLAASIMSRVSDVFAVDLAVRKLFENPTVASLALVIVEEISKGGQPGMKIQARK